MNFDGLKKFKNDCETQKIYIYFVCPHSYYSQDGIDYLRSEWDIAKRKFILSFSSMPIYNINKEKYDLAYSKKDILGVNNLYGEKFLQYVFTNIEMEKNAVIYKIYNDLSNKNSNKDEFIPIYFIPMYFYDNTRKLSNLDNLKKEILIEFPGLNLYNLTNYDYRNIDQKFSNKYGNFIENFKLTIEQEKEYIFNTFTKRGGYNFKPSKNEYDIPENICITSLNVYNRVKYKPENYKLNSSDSFNENNKSYNSFNSKNQYNKNNKYNKYNNSKNDNLFTNSSNKNMNQKNTNSYNSYNSSNNFKNEDINDFIKLVNLYNINQTSMSLDNIDTFGLQAGLDSSKIDRIKYHILSNPTLLNNQLTNFDNTNSSFEDTSNTTDYYNTNFDYNNFEDNHCEYDNYFDYNNTEDDDCDYNNYFNNNICDEDYDYEDYDYEDYDYDNYNEYEENNEYEEYEEYEDDNNLF